MNHMANIYATPELILLGISLTVLSIIPLPQKYWGDVVANWIMGDSLLQNTSGFA